MKHLVLAFLLVLGAVAGCATPSNDSDCCERKEIKKELRAEGKGYFDATGKYHDHAATAMVWTVCNCKVCDRKDKCCGPNHCVCNPN